MEVVDVGAVAGPVDGNRDQGAVRDAVTRYVSIGLVVGVARSFGVLPAEAVAVEVEPESTVPSTKLPAIVERALPEAAACALACAVACPATM